jgi:dihydrolipoamide dehydrogenase
VGCIPSKAMLQNSLMYHQTQHDLKKRGIEVDNITLNLPVMRAAKDKAVKQLTGGVAGLFKKNKVDWLKGLGTFTSASSIQVTPSEGEPYEVKSKNFIIATGSESSPFPGIEIDEKQVVTSTGALDIEKVPEKMVVIGGGIIGLEMGSVWSRLGAKVDVVEFLGSIGGVGVDGEVANTFQKILKKQGLNFQLNTKVIGMEKRDGKCYLKVEPSKGGEQKEVRRRWRSAS